ncbi:glycine betaine ABC transporter substrate-binding protein [Neisseria zalophi]|uniref:ABC transporter permease subunit n=1 Tax=Neisseria zalophi TaxID=640030 RepID=A0A5J6PXJ4_9NEIS|nr:glycine betaine ABC transporter substrate-binding protein [Neisseria zalophi]QEY25577.1 ABC transporter permease subunit [Neisseria zalophi]
MKFLKYLYFVMVLMLTAPFAAAACEDGQTIKLAGLDWESGQFTTAVLNTILQDGYGCQTSTVPGTGTALETALAQNDIQIIAEQWIGRSPVMQKAVDEHKAAVVGDTLKGGATQGWYVPDYVKQEHSDLNSIEDLKKFAYLFPDPEAPQRARFLNCPSGWTCEIANSRLLDNTGLGEVFDNVRPGTGAALDAEITSAYEQKRPILFYYWQPTGLMAKYRFEPLEFPEHNAACWATILDANSQNRCVSGYPVSKLAVAVSTPFMEAHPDLVEMIKRLQFEPDMLNRAILEMSENQRSGEEQAQLFLKQNPHVWQQWVSEEAAGRLSEALGVAAPESSGIFRTWSISDGLNKSLKNTVQKHGEQLRSAGEVTLRILLPLERLLQTVPAWLVILVVGAIGLHATHKWWFALLCMFGFYTIGSFGLWEALMQTIALLTASVLLTMIIGIPVGIFTAYRKRLYQLLSPVLDVMQTMPSFVYLIPVLMLFGIGKVPALFATVVYALAPLIRLTALGIRQVSPQMIEAAIAFGSNRWQLLKWVLLPQAKPSIMAGINQAVMMSLGMVVLASMIGARGLGEYVLQAVQTLNIGQGVEAGAAIVILAIIIDRITQAYGSREKGSRHE